MVARGRSAKRLGELLMERGLLTASQLEQALAHQRLTKAFLGAVLLELHLVPPKQLLAALSEQFGIPCESLRPEQVDWAVVDQFPSSALSDEHCFPIRADAASLTVAIANPLNAWALSAVEQTARFQQVKLVLVLPSDLALVRQAYQRRIVQRMTQQPESHGHD